MNPNRDILRQKLREANPFVDGVARLSISNRFVAKFAAAFVALALIATTSAAHAQSGAKPEVQREVAAKLLDETEVRGQLTELSTTRVTLRSAEKSQSFTDEQLGSLIFTEIVKIPPHDAARIKLVDGSDLVATEWKLADGKVEWKSPLDAAATTPIADVAILRLQATPDALGERWRQISAASATGDRIVIRKGDTTLDSVEGIVRGATADKIQFEIDGEVSQVDRKKVFALLFYHKAGRSLGKPACTSSDYSNMHFATAALALEGDHVAITTLTGQKFVRPFDKMSRVDFAAAKTTYLSDLTPESTEWTPLVGPATPELTKMFEPKTDRALLGGPLQLPRREGRQTTSAANYAKGLALHSRTKIVYRLPREFRTFGAIAGIDSRMRPAGAVKLVISGDDKQLFSAAVTGKDEPQPLSLDVRGVRRLTIFVDYGEGLDVADHLDLANARLVE
jgi:hypothetical protein